MKKTCNDLEFYEEDELNQPANYSDAEKGSVKCLPICWK